MKAITTLARRHAKRLLALVILFALSLLMRSATEVSPAARAEGAARFRFTRESLPPVAGPPHYFVRETHPSVKHMAAYMSVISASAAFADVDGNGMANDICYVETRTDQLIVAPAPGTSADFRPFTLTQSPPLVDNRTMKPMVCQPGDVNEDGHTDFIVSYLGRTPVTFLWRAPGDYVARALIEGNSVWTTTSLNLADLDGDGHLDLIVSNYYKDGTDVFNPEGVGRVYLPESFSRAYNGGGVRIFRWTGATAGTDPTVSFTEVPDALPGGVGGGWGFAVATGDLDGDFLPEFYVANDFGPDRLFHNRSARGQIRFALLEGERTFTTPISKVVGRDSFKGMGVDFGDLNGDGLLDIFVSNITEPYIGHESHYAFISTGDVESMRRGVAPYVDRSEQLGLSRSGWGWEARLADLDNDGVLEALQALGFVRGNVSRWPEIQELGMANDTLIPYTEVSWPRIQPGDDVSGHNKNPFYVRVGDRYIDVAAEVGFGEDSVSRGIATSDVDGDGDLDMAVANQWGPSTFYRNDCPRCGSFLGLRLLIPLRQAEATQTAVVAGRPAVQVPSRAAIGASATVWLPDGRRLVSQVDGSNGHTGKRSPELHFGLSRVNQPLRVDLKWRDADGNIHAETLNLSPGWHTVLLGGSVEGGSR